MNFRWAWKHFVELQPQKENIDQKSEATAGNLNNEGKLSAEVEKCILFSGCFQQIFVPFWNPLYEVSGLL